MVTVLAILMLVVLVIGFVGIIYMMSQSTWNMLVFSGSASAVWAVIVKLVVLIFESFNES